MNDPILAIRDLKMHFPVKGGVFSQQVAAVKAVDGSNIKIFGVTALTSLSDDDALTIFKRTAKDQVDAMLDLAEEAGIDGVVCSPHELTLVTKRKSLQSITPGIRIAKAIDDQSRVMSPREAIERGSNYLVIGRPITEAKDINATLNEIYNSIQ